VIQEIRSIKEAIETNPEQVDQATKAGDLEEAARLRYRDLMIWRRAQRRPTRVWSGCRAAARC